MIIRLGRADEVRELWGRTHSNTENYFVNGIKNNQIEFWAIEHEEDKRLIGELYIIWNSVDQDEADGKTRAYLCAFRVKKEFQGRKLGKALMMCVFERIKEQGFSEVTIGIDPENESRLKPMYESFGFKQFIKMCHYDYHCFDQNNKPIYYDEPAPLYLKSF